ncbi:MAG TPA: tyrosine-type recombinase/integrase [Casimicrobiaceae bacterium]|nr:tyrosine-type recombinase/integrase [Casimicrobiaceae bacterium]
MCGGEPGTRTPDQRIMTMFQTVRMADIRIHDLRRTLGSWQARTGASLSIIGRSLNHKSVQTTAIYARLDTDPVRASVERATSAILAAAGVKPKRELKKMGKTRR